MSIGVIDAKWTHWTSLVIALCMITALDYLDCVISKSKIGKRKGRDESRKEQINWEPGETDGQKKNQNGVTE